ncbi:putative BPIFA4P protein [Manis javanica]|nr:putative BPIFA4P protein isoform X1 [Manis javanica]XP_036868851.1 putative BPIFA4P protein isoform X2 [Manis javanica]
MLRISSLFLLLCGLLASSSAQEVLSTISSQMSSALTQGLLNVDFGPALQTINFGDSYNQQAGIFDILASPFMQTKDSVQIQLRNPQLLQISLQNSYDSRTTDLRIPLSFSMYVKYNSYSPQLFQIRTETRVPIQLGGDGNGGFRLIFGQCRIVPETIWIQPDNSGNNNVNWENMQKNLKYLVIQGFGANMCSFLNSWLYNLNSQMTNELINLLQQGGYQAAM